MNKIKIFIFFVCFIFFINPSFSFQELDRIIAIVNKEPITYRDLEDGLNKAYSFFKQNKIQPPEESVIEKKVLDELIEKISNEFHKDPRNKVFAPQELLIASVKEEMGEDISTDRLSSIVSLYKEGEIDGDEEEIYDAAVYSCGVLARKCFADDPEDEDAEVDYEISWIENEDGSITAEIRPS